MVIPKSLVLLGDRPLLERSILRPVEHGVRRSARRAHSGPWRTSALTSAAHGGPGPIDLGAIDHRAGDERARLAGTRSLEP